MRKRIPKTEIALLLSAALLLPTGSRAAEAPAVSAESAVLAERETGRILYEKCPDKPMKAASTVKILTALIAIERLDPAERVTIRPEWTGVEGSSMHLRPGEECTVADLLRGMLLVSGNDAALALACLTAGSEEAFAALMNGKAAALGMADSRFADPSGLASEGHRVTARDMAVLTRAAMAEPLFREIVASRTAEAAGRSLVNHNKLLWRYEGAVGVKTGYTKAAGRTLVSCAEREGLQLVCVTLNDPDDWADHAALLDWGFASWRRGAPEGLGWTLEVVGGEEKTAEAVPEGASDLLLPREGLRWEVSLPRFVYAPVTAGETAGRLRCLGADGETLADLPLVWASSVAADPSQPLSFWEKLRWAWRCACRRSAARPQYVFY